MGASQAVAFHAVYTLKEAELENVDTVIASEKTVTCMNLLGWVPFTQHPDLELHSALLEGFSCGGKVHALIMWHT